MIALAWPILPCMRPPPSRILGFQRPPDRRRPSPGERNPLVRDPLLKRLFGHAEVVETLIRDMLPEDVGRIDFATLENGPATGWIGFWPSASGHG